MWTGIKWGYFLLFLFHNEDMGVLCVDMDQEAAVINRYARTIAEEEKLEGLRLKDFFDLSNIEEDAIFLRSMDDIYGVRLWNPSGTKAYSFRMNAVRDSFNDPFCYMCVFVDVTEEVEAVSKFEIASRAKSRFLAQMSHEIRTPINAVLGMNEMILRESDDQDILEYSHNISSAGNTLLSLINSILDFSKIEDGKMEIVPITYDLAFLINDMVNSITQRADTKGLEFIVNIDENLPSRLIGDDIRISQVIMNLLTNAVKYTEKGSVCLKMMVHEIIGSNVEIFVSVSDTGIGIRDEDRKKLFESFERLDEKRNHNIEGTGLGMSIVTSLLDLMGTRLDVKSVYGEGTVFSFIISQQIEDPSPIGNYEERLKQINRSGGKEAVICAPFARVLLVDDNNMNLKVVNNLLKLCSIKPDIVSSGQDAIEYIKKNTYDIVFLDHMMPHMDGVETLLKLSDQHLLTPETTVIALTANAVTGAKDYYLRMGFKDYLTKPIDISSLVEMLTTYLPKEAYNDVRPKEEIHVVAEDILEFEPGGGSDDVLEFEPDGDDDILEFMPDEDMSEGSAQKSYYKEKLAACGINIASGMTYCGDDEDFSYIYDYHNRLISTLKDAVKSIKSAL